MAGGDLQAAWDLLQPLILTGFALGAILAVMVGAIRIAWLLAPYIILASALLWFFG